MKAKKWFLNLKLNSKFTLVSVTLVMVPIICMSVFLLYIFKRNSVEEDIMQMQNLMEQSTENISGNLDALNLTTQFFLKDEGLTDMLQRAADGEEIGIREIQEFKNVNINSLERLVNNNRSLYSVRAYDSADRVQEMMPILYRNSRMQRQSWADQPEGWKIGCGDAIFGGQSEEGQPKLIALVTPVYGKYRERIGTIEAAMTMEEMFPELYGSIQSDWGCVVKPDGSLYFGGDDTEYKKQIAAGIREEYASEKESLTFYGRYAGRNIVAAHIYISALDCEFILVKDITGVLRRFNWIGVAFGVAIVLLAVNLAVLIDKIVRLLLGRFYRILSVTHDVQKGNLDVHFDDSGSDEMSELGNQMNRMMERIKQLMAEGIQRETLVKNSEIKALQNQINAHFIYNVLESIKMMAEIDERYDISDAITALGELLRYGMRWAKANVTVAQEIDYIKNYIQLMNLRYDFTIQLSVKMPEWVYRQQIPKMSLQPIVENAICHGIEELSEDATIYIKVVEGDESYTIEITDSGIGMDQEHVELLTRKINGEIEVSGGSGNGIGLKNVQDRIRIAFGNEYGISVVSRELCFTKIRVYLPVTDRQKEGES